MPETKNIFQRYEELTQNFRPMAGTMAHLEAIEVMGQIKKKEEAWHRAKDSKKQRMIELEIERLKRHVVWLLSGKPAQMEY